MTRQLTAIITLLLLGACAGDGTITPPPPPPVGSVQVELAATTVEVGRTTTATATVLDAAEQELAGRTVSWSSSDPAVATVSQSGQVLALAVGTTTITATSESRTGVAELVVVQQPVHSITLDALVEELTPNYPTIVYAVVRDLYGSVLSDRPVAWLSSNPGVATVDAEGLVVGVAEGSTTISATAEGVTGTLAITVLPATVASVTSEQHYVTIAVGQVDTLRAVVRDIRDTALLDRTPGWGHNDIAPFPSTITSSGVLTGHFPGQNAVSPWLDGYGGFNAITVSTVPVASVTTEPAAVTLRVGEVAMVLARARDAADGILYERTVRWSSTDSTIATGYSNLTKLWITGLRVGTTTWTAKVAGHVVHIPVTVTPPLVANRCEQIAGADVYGVAQTVRGGPPRLHLGRLTNRNDPWSVINPDGVFGSRDGALSTNNPLGNAGTFNSGSNFTPILIKDGVAIATYSLNVGSANNVSPAFVAATCEFP